MKWFPLAVFGWGLCQPRTNPLTVASQWCHDDPKTPNTKLKYAAEAVEKGSTETRMDYLTPGPALHYL